MLIQFTFRSFRSYKEDTVLDLSATKYTEHEGHVVSLYNEKLLPAAAIFGANGSGKTNVLRAFAYMKECVDTSAIQPVRLCPQFMPQDEKYRDSVFEVYFIEEESGRTYRYGFSLNEEGIYDEWLDVKSRTGKDYRIVMFRNDNDMEIPAAGANQRRKIEADLNPHVLMLSLLIRDRIPKASPAAEFFRKIRFISALDLPAVKPEIAEDPELLPYLASFDSSIAAAVQENGRLLIERKSEEGTARIPLEAEAEGIQRMTALYPVLKQVMKEGGVLCADNLDCGLHTLLVRNILITFLNASTNPAHAQLIFTTHDSWLLSNHIFRRDEIWFTAKDTKNVSSLYSLAEFQDEDGVKIRKDENHEKNYMMGKYGAVPELDYLHLFTE